MSSHCVKSLHLERGVRSRIITSVRLSVSPALVARRVWYMARNTQYFIVDFIVDLILSDYAILCLRDRNVLTESCKEK